MQAAWQLYDAILADDRFGFVGEPANVEGFARRLTDKTSRSTKRWQDAWLAALAIAGRYRLAMLDSGFRSFEGLDLTLIR